MVAARPFDYLYAELPTIARDPAKAKQLMADAGQDRFEHDLTPGQSQTMQPKPLHSHTQSSPVPGR